MILQAPTGSYLPILSKGPLDPISIIYTVSAGPPPRSTAPVLKIPDGVRDQLKYARLFTDKERRATIGDLVFVTKTTNPVKVHGGSRPYGYGQILEFIEDEPENPITAVPVSDSVVTKHNNSYLDIANLGLTAEDQEELAAEALATQRSILDQISELQKRRSSLEIDISDLQSQINEATKALAGLRTILNSGGRVQKMVEKVNIKLLGLNAQLESISIEYNSVPDKITTLYDNLVTLTDLVK